MESQLYLPVHLKLKILIVYFRVTEQNNTGQNEPHNSWVKTFRICSEKKGLEFMSPVK